MTPQLVLRAPDKKLIPVIAATRHALDIPQATGLDLFRLIWIWVWVLMVCRPGLTVLHASYKFISKHREDPTRHMLWPPVLDGLFALHHLAPLFLTDLMVSWSRDVFATDASAQRGRVWSDEVSLHPEREVREEASKAWPSPLTLFWDDDMEPETSASASTSPPPQSFTLPSSKASSSRRRNRRFADVVCGAGGFGASILNHLPVLVLFIDNLLHSVVGLTEPKLVRRMVGLITQAWF